MLQLHGAIYRLDPFVFILHYCANLKVIRHESATLNRIAADKSHCVIAALVYETSITNLSPVKKVFNSVFEQLQNNY